MWWVPRRYCDASECVTSWQLFPRTTPAAREFRLLSFYSFLSSSSCCFVIILIFLSFRYFFCIVFAFFLLLCPYVPLFSLTLFLTFLCLSFFTNIITMNYYRVFLLKYTTIYLTLPTLTAIKIPLYDNEYNKPHLNLTRKTIKHRKNISHVEVHVKRRHLCGAHVILKLKWDIAPTPGDVSRGTPLDSPE